MTQAVLYPYHQYIVGFMLIAHGTIYIYIYIYIIRDYYLEQNEDNL